MHVTVDATGRVLLYARARMRFGPWHRLHEAAAAAPQAAGVLQVRLETGLVVYPRGKSAMILYAAADDLRAACSRLAAEHPHAAWLCRFDRGSAGEPRAAAEALIADFVDRFGQAPAPPRGPR